MVTYSELPGISIRPLATLEEFYQAEIAQREIWQLPDSSWLVPANLLLTAQKNGGLVAGAFDENDAMVGILYGFIGLTRESKFKHCSHIMGIVPGVRRQNIGRALKLFQRQYVRAQGLDLVTWTYDPLESVNASLNIARLGALAHTYYENLYGAWNDGLNSGLPTDRFEVEWWINSARVSQFTQGERERAAMAILLDAGGGLINETEVNGDGLLTSTEPQLGLTAETLLLEIPPEFQAIKAVAMEAAAVWRQQTRAAFQHYFAAGYTITDFISNHDAGRRHSFYVFSRTLILA